MKKLKNLTRKIALFCAAALLLGLLPVTAYARDSVDLTKDVSLTISFTDGSTAVSGASFSLYRIADMDENADFTATADFANSGVDLSPVYDGGESVWSQRASALSSYIAQKSADGEAIKPAANGTTDSNGQIKFNKNDANLSAGLYLFIGASTQAGDTIYTPSPTLITLPYNDEINDKWDYDPIVSPKYEKSTVEPETTDLSAIVVWEDNDDKLGLRPDEVVVVLSRVVSTADGVSYEEYDRVTLNLKDSNWRHTWENVLANEEWQVSELLLPESYTYTVSREGDTFIITNTISEQPTVSPTPTSGPSATPSANPTATPTATPTKLPQTGQLWWPISFLAIGGFVLLVLGMTLRRRETAG